MSLRKQNGEICFESTRNLKHEKEAQSPQIVPQALKKGLVGSEDVEALKRALYDRYDDEWAQFFLRWAFNAEQQHKQTLAKIEASREEIKAKIEAEVRDETHKLVQFHKLESQSLREKLSYLQARELQREREESEALERKKKVANRQRLPLRDAATFPEFIHAIKVVEAKKRTKPFIKARDKVALLLLYSTGMRISNLLHCTVISLQPLLNGGVFTVPAIKSHRRGKIEWPISTATQELALKYRQDILALCLGKEGNQKVFTAEGSLKPIRRAHLDMQINAILKETSKETGKNLSSHSFRIGQTTNLIEIAGLEQASKLIGHSGVATTVLYNRSSITLRQRKSLIHRLENAKQGRIPRRWKRKPLSFLHCKNTRN